MSLPALSIKKINKILQETIKFCYLHPVKLTLVFIPFEFQPDAYHLTIDWEFLPFGPLVTHLTIQSNSTGNTDPRGGGCGDFDIPLEDFQWQCQNPAGISLKDLTEAVYRMKGSKYDYWYELLGNVQCDIQPPTVHCTVQFDYGS